MRHDKDSRLPTYRYKNRLQTIHEEDKPEIYSEKDKVSSTDETYKRLAKLDEILYPGLVNKYFKNNSLKEMIEQLKYFRRQGKESIEYKNKMARIALGFWKLKKDIKNISENEVKNKGLDLLSDFIRNVIDANSNWMVCQI